MGKYKKLVAFSVMEEDENTGDIYFAKSDIEARKRGADEFADGEISYVTCRRAQWADKFAPGPVPFSAKFEQGWWVECSGCGVTIQEGGYDSKGNEIDFEIVEVGDAVYCTPACRERRLAGAVPVADWPRILDEPVQIFVEHETLQWCRAEDADDRRGWCDAYWTDFNGGGWVWHGICGRVTHVRPRVVDEAA